MTGDSKDGAPPVDAGRLVVALIAGTVAILAPLAWLWQLLSLVEDFPLWGWAISTMEVARPAGHDHARRPGR